MTHYEYASMSQEPVTCRAEDLTFGGRCLNCGYELRMAAIPITIEKGNSKMTPRKMTPRKMTPTEFIEQTAQKLIDQGGYATNGMVCMYRAKDGNKCAIGVWLPDELYTPEMEQKLIPALWGFRGVPEFFKSLIDIATDEFLQDFLISVQRKLHDRRVGYLLLTPAEAVKEVFA